MFGHDNSQSDNSQVDAIQPDPSIIDPAALNDDTNVGLAGATDNTQDQAVDNNLPTDAPVYTPSDDQPSFEVSPNEPVVDNQDIAPADNSGSTDLLDIKQQVLQTLTPIVHHLEQDSSEKFATTMMMIQATDNQDLIPAAYQAAQEIPDEKQKAQALLDIVKEINYFTQEKNNQN